MVGTRLTITGCVDSRRAAIFGGVRSAPCIQLSRAICYLPHCVTTAFCFRPIWSPDLCPLKQSADILNLCRTQLNAGTRRLKRVPPPSFAMCFRLRPRLLVLRLSPRQPASVLAAVVRWSVAVASVSQSVGLRTNSGHVLLHAIIRCWLVHTTHGFLILICVAQALIGTRLV